MSQPTYDDCILHIGGRNSKGYGKINKEGEQLAHRLAFKRANPGVGIAGLCVCHHCDNPPCINPKHLFLGTIQDNNADRHRKGRTNATGYPAPRTTTFEVACKVRELKATGLSTLAICRVLNLSRGVVRHIINNRTYLKDSA